MTKNDRLNPKGSIPAYLPVVFQDRVLYCMRQVGDMLIHCVITFNGKIDASRLDRAYRLSLDAVPELGCCYEQRFTQPRWKRCDDLDSYIYRDVVEGVDVDAQTRSYLTKPIDPFSGPRVRYRLIRAENDRLCIKLDHIAGDAGAVKIYAYMLASIYRELGKNPDFYPAPDIETDRDIRIVLNSLSVYDQIRSLYYGVRNVKNWSFPLRFPDLEFEGDKSEFFIHRIEGDRYRAIKDFCKARHVTVNDLLLTAFTRAMAEKIGTPTPNDIRFMATADLRRYLPPGEKDIVTNLSGFVYLNAGRDNDRSFTETLRIVKSQMDQIKKELIGTWDFIVTPRLNPFVIDEVGRPLLEKAMNSIASKGRAKALTNMGRVLDDRLDFGRPDILDAFLTAPVMFPPSFVIGASGYKDSLTLSMGTQIPEGRDSGYKQLFDLLIQCLVNGVSEYI